MSESENIVQYTPTFGVTAIPALVHAQKGRVQLGIAEYYSPTKSTVQKDHSVYYFNLQLNNIQVRTLMS